ncbi:2-polyprenyl-6-methoxyphenol hydroxylase-like FAD-dependent oxidoreductase [Actinoplanes lutulentus]|uniref:2-polyprenyl-6-methoxyphenol hydroxylase-like FAD-dependent oxidoreductase n=1 Tax=Actinoplanes lutulentus TaxID=1287878 RepID=A0A327YWP0_9ACTN|nr:NAD(P)/FAD-dependent oxidoreductase [Actinoplanes lutulentus]MBB2940397.1 2-polyprenyl-6-methoxyphenol hydroxylase-like FAD-dependent oxidoreductase [Actinoplanes lutulentus]RAK25870.1 2-polyprenyl-6-methoxyphenol hydroxylase-like FAD-dependent oxidoreductase [Actinoplanes lutulentus]
MTNPHYDVIVVGARCAGAPLATLLARQGHRTLLVDRATFPSDTVSTHVIHPPGAAALKRWGLLDQVAATGCPPVGKYSFDFGPISLTGAPGTPESPYAYAPRRLLLDKILVDAAVAAGVEVREDYSVDELLFDDGRVTGIRGTDGASEHARFVVGADGRNSIVAKSVKAEQYAEQDPLTVGYYGYWSNLPTDTFEAYSRPGRGWAVCPTNDDLTLVIGGWPHAELAEHRNDIEGELYRTFALSPAFAERIAGAKLESKLVGSSVPNYFRVPFGPGWALVGDAGYNRDYITAQGITDAFLDAENLAAALDIALTGTEPEDAALRGYQETRDARAMPVYQMTLGIASLQPPDEQMVQLVSAIIGDQEKVDAFTRLNSGVTNPAEFFAPENIGKLLS